jgi:hypothetical protein
LLLSLLEELNIVEGSLEVKGSVFYVPQEPWIFSGTIKQNIIFGKVFDKEKFQTVVDVCCLKQVSERAETFILLFIRYIFLEIETILGSSSAPAQGKNDRRRQGCEFEWWTTSSRWIGKSFVQRCTNLFARRSAQRGRYKCRKEAF